MTPMTTTGEAAHDPVDCPDCRMVTATATAASGYTAAAVALCPAGRAESAAAYAAAREADPDIAAVHRMLGWA